MTYVFGPKQFFYAGPRLLYLTRDGYNGFLSKIDMDCLIKWGSGAYLLLHCTVTSNYHDLLHNEYFKIKEQNERVNCKTTISCKIRKA